MKKQIHPNIPLHLYELINMESKRRGGMGVSAIVESALENYFNPEGGTQTQEQVLKRLSAISRKLDNQRLENSLLTEMLAQFAKNSFIFQPDVPVDQREELSQQAERRYNQFMERVAQSVAAGNKNFENMTQEAFLHASEIPDDLMKDDWPSLIFAKILVS